MAEVAPIVIEIQGLEELQDALGKFGSQWQSLASEALMPGLAMLESGAKQFAPVDTGRLRASIASEIERARGSEIIGKVGSDVEYASYQEFGTRYQTGTPYLRPSLEKNRAAVVRLFEQGIRQVLRRLRLA